MQFAAHESLVGFGFVHVHVFLLPSHQTLECIQVSPTERNPSSRNNHRRRSPGNGQEGEAPPYLKSHVMNPTESTVHRSEARALIYGELQVTSRYRSGTPGGLGPGVQKTSRSGNFEFCQLLLVCLGIGNMATPTASPPSVAFQLWPSLA